MTQNRIPPFITVLVSTLFWLLIGSALGLFVPHDSKLYSSLLSWVAGAATIFGFIFVVYQHAKFKGENGYVNVVNVRTTVLQVLLYAGFGLLLIVFIVLFFNHFLNFSLPSSSFSQGVDLAEAQPKTPSFDYFSWKNAGDIATGLGALGTVGTLIYLIIQNNALKKLQEEQEKDNSKFREAQHSALLKNDFYELLSDLENHSVYPCTYTHKYMLYQSIERRCKDEVDDENSEHNILLALKVYFEELNVITAQIAEPKPSMPKVSKLFETIKKIEDELKLRFDNRPSYGDVSHKGSSQLIVNIFKVNDYLEHLHYSASMLSNFFKCSVEFEHPQLNDDVADKIKSHCFNYTRWGLFDVNLPNVNSQYLKVFNAAYRVICLGVQESSGLVADYSDRSSLMYTYWAKSRFTETFDNLDLLDMLLTNIRDDLYYNLHTYARFVGPHILEDKKSINQMSKLLTQLETTLDHLTQEQKERDKNSMVNL